MGHICGLFWTYFIGISFYWTVEGNSYYYYFCQIDQRTKKWAAFIETDIHKCFSWSLLKSCRPLVWLTGCALLLSPLKAFCLYTTCLCDFHVCRCCLAQEDILDLQLQRNLDYLDQQVREYIHSIACPWHINTLCYSSFFPSFIPFLCFLISWCLPVN